MKQEKHATLRWMNRVAGKSKGYIAVLCILQILTGLGGVAYALLFRRLVNAAVAGDRDGFFASVAIFIGIVAAQIVLGTVGRFVSEYTVSTVENRFKERLFSALVTGDYASVTGIHSGEWMNRLTSDTSIVAGEVVQLLPGLVGLVVRLVGALTVIILIEHRLLYILVPGGVLLVLFSYSFRKVLKRLHKKIREADGKVRVFFQERLGSLLIVRTFSKEQQSVEQAAKLMKDHRKIRMKRSLFSGFTGMGFSVAMNGLYVLGAIFCGHGILTGSMSYGNLTAIMQLIGQVGGPLASISGVVPRYYSVLASAERLIEAENFRDDLSEELLSDEDVKEFYRDRFSGLSLKNVSFTYRPPVQKDDLEPKMPIVFSNLNLEIRKGEYVAFAGPSGCGKSTVLKLLMCLYPPDSGDRLLMTRNGAEQLDARWRGLFAYVPQGNQLLSGTIREIVAFGDPTKMQQEERLHQALRIACADEFVSGLEQGLDTVLGERGAGLSEGQMQRLAIARAVFSDRPVLMLDECTSALDNETERKLLLNLRTMTDRTVVLVTHRPAAMEICDETVQF